MIELRALGAVDLRRQDGAELLSVLSQPKRTALLLYLVLAHPHGCHRRDRLVALFWPEADTEHGRNSLRQSVHFLRRSLGDDVLVSRGEEELGVAEGKLWCDVQAFEAALDRGDVEGALHLFGGELLPGFFVEGTPEFERWLEGERTRLRGRAVRAACELAQARERAGDGAGAAEMAARALALAPEDEALLRGQMQLLERLGDRAAAIAAYQAHARRLLVDYELEPGPATRTLAEEIRARHNLAAAPGPPETPATRAGAATRATPPEVPPSSVAAAPSAPLATTPARGRRSLPWAVAAALVLLALGVAGWIAGREAPHLDPRRVVVLPFENATGDSTLTPLGRMIADVLTQAVATSGFAEAVPPPPVPDPRAPRIPSRSAQQFARAAGAGIVITGRYFVVGEAVEVEAHAVALDGREREIGVPPVRAPRARPDAVAEAARNRLMGVLAAQLDRPPGETTLASRGMRPPTYEAYRAFTAAWAHFDEHSYAEAAAAFRQALQLDTTFYSAAVALGAALNNAGRAAAAESVWLAVAPHRGELEPESRIDLEVELASVEGNWAHAYRVIRDLPGRSPFSNHDLAYAAMALRRPREALRLLETGPPAEYLTGTERWSGFHTIKGNALFVLGEHEAELRAARRGLELFPDVPAMVAREGRALAALGRIAEARTRVETLLRRSPALAFGIIDVIALRDGAAARDLHERALATLEQRGDSSVAIVRLRARALLALGRLAEARALCRAIRARQPQDAEALLCLGLAAARAGDRSSAAGIERELAALPGYPVARARNTMRRAMIAATLGERDRAVQLGADAYAAGQPYEPALLYAPEFANVRGYPPFDELMRPLDR